MKLNIEVKRKEWIWVAVCILVVYLAFSGKSDSAVRLVKDWVIRL